MKIQVVIKPSARKTEVKKLADGSYRVAVKAPPIEGRANAALIEALADHFDRPKTSLKIVHGLKGKKKIIELD